mmetsp:Transcript_30666/g.50997  ORF Transcript_30666/g.50997 Transcript_30666/m.50997 type:complete len:301 (-) Transcript_30666:24-926(-)|eukprot:CAMPEP_0178831142 /NCGR_PEP_ID=MMETSP0746-20121128/9298_1 /TAXON_ID=913974 /ORGANISM="Nitzschia punctata, Strain CCMP561" /LENGTH=300 /DNA_ID=CAMNT_0020493355 /DNA_START=564 /DNA_END=1466 /DNA_ORIENTATION=-
MARTPKPSASNKILPSSSNGAENDDGGNSSDVSDLLSTAPGTSSTTAPSTPQSYAIPQWLVPEKKSAKYFSLKLPPVPTDTEKAIRSYLQKQYSQNPGVKESTRMIHQITQLQQEEKEAASSVKMAKERLAQAVAAKTEGIEEIRKTKEVETKKALEDLERTMRKEQEKEYQKVEEKIKEQVLMEYEQKFEEAKEKKRKREQEEEEERQQEETENRAKRQKLSHPEKEDSGEGNDKKDQGSSKTQELEKKRQDLQEKMEKLSEKKSEMFWLLKQVIMQETKQKMERMKQKKLEATKAAAT